MGAVNGDSICTFNCEGGDGRGSANCLLVTTVGLQVQQGLRGLIKHNYIDTIIIRILIIQCCSSIVCRPLRLRPTRKSISGGVARNGDLQTNKLLYVYENLCVFVCV